MTTSFGRSKVLDIFFATFSLYFLQCSTVSGSVVAGVPSSKSAISGSSTFKVSIPSSSVLSGSGPGTSVTVSCTSSVLSPYIVRSKGSKGLARGPPSSTL